MKKKAEEEETLDWCAMPIDTDLINWLKRSGSEGENPSIFRKTISADITQEVCESASHWLRAVASREAISLTEMSTDRCKAGTLVRRDSKDSLGGAPLP